MTDKQQIIINNDIMQLWEPQAFGGASGSDTSIVHTCKNFDHFLVLLNFGVVDPGVIMRLEFEACSGVDGSDAVLIEPIYFRQKLADGSDTWTTQQTIADGQFDIVGGNAHVSATEDLCLVELEFNAAEIYNEGVAAADNIVRDCFKVQMIHTNADG
ncbi:unnamed protein product, partial [marine sediment metagenome]